MYTSAQGMYRSRRGMILGVCRGLGEYFDLSVFWLRVITLIAFIVSGFFPVGLGYVILALLMKKEPY